MLVDCPVAGVTERETNLLTLLSNVTGEQYNNIEKHPLDRKTVDEIENTVANHLS